MRLNAYNPAIVANYVYELAKLYNRFYFECKVLQSDKPRLRRDALYLVKFYRWSHSICFGYAGDSSPRKDVRGCRI